MEKQQFFKKKTFFNGKTTIFQEKQHFLFGSASMKKYQIQIFSNTLKTNINKSKNTKCS